MEQCSRSSSKVYQYQALTTGTYFEMGLLCLRGHLHHVVQLSLLSCKINTSVPTWQTFTSQRFENAKASHAV